MLGVFGLSHRLPLFNKELKDIFARHISFYKKNVREFIKGGIVSKLAPREFVEEIDLYAVQYSLKEQGRVLVVVFAKFEQQVVLKLKELCPEMLYRVDVTDTAVHFEKTGSELMEDGLELG
jgi:alpha-galactosidase